MATKTQPERAPKAQLNQSERVMLCEALSHADGFRRRMFKACDERRINLDQLDLLNKAVAALEMFHLGTC